MAQCERKNNDSCKMKLLSSLSVPLSLSRSRSLSVSPERPSERIGLLSAVRVWVLAVVVWARPWPWVQGAAFVLGNSVKNQFRVCKIYQLCI